MKKNETINDKINTLVNQIARLNAFAEIIEREEQELKWYMDISTIDGESIRTEPQPGSPYYDDYIARRNAIDEIIALV